jgi:hypothetical protein
MDSNDQASNFQISCDTLSTASYIYLETSHFSDFRNKK